MGGAVAQHMVLQAPDCVLSQVLCASFFKLDPLGVRVLLNMREALVAQRFKVLHERFQMGQHRLKIPRRVFGLQGVYGLPSNNKTDAPKINNYSLLRS